MNKILDRIQGNQHSSCSFDVINPATEEAIITLTDHSKTDTTKAIEKAEIAQVQWQALTAKERSNILRKWYNLIIENIDDLAQIITLESGKPLTESKSEVIYGANFIEWYAEKAKRIDGKLIDSPLPNTQIMVTYEPIGVVGAITPWNFPFAMITRKLAPAFAAGCGVVIKPSELTPISAYAAKLLAIDAGIPADLFGIVCGTNSKTIGEELTSNKIVKKITFTGSTNVGKILMAQSANSIKKMSLELGGNAPFIVFNSADIDNAVTSLLNAKNRNAGQVCIAPNRILVQGTIKEEFISKLKDKISQIVVGNGLDKDVTMGPLINQQAIEKSQQHIDDAINKGAKLIFGGKPHKLGGTFFEPTILDNMSKDMLTSQEEIFGPIYAIYSFTTEDEAIKMANNTPFGLASYFFSQDINQIKRVRKTIQAGMVGINTGVISNEAAPFGGIKESGLGREGSDDGIYEFLEAKYSMQAFI